MKTEPNPNNNRTTEQYAIVCIQLTVSVSYIFRGIQGLRKAGSGQGVDCSGRPKFGFGYSAECGQLCIFGRYSASAECETYSSAKPSASAEAVIFTIGQPLLLMFFVRRCHVS